MRSAVTFYSSCLSLLLCLPLLASFTAAQQAEPIVDWGHLSSLVDRINERILHSALHELSPKFQDGVFSKDRSAIEHVHSESPAVATKLVHIAMKRQISNSTTAAVEPTSTTSAEASTTPSDQASAISSELSSEIQASTVPSETSVTVPPSSPADTTPVATRDGGVVYSTIGGGLVTLTSSAVGVKFTPSTSTHLFYSTQSNGDVHTSTSVVVVNAPITQAAESGTQSTATTTATTTSSKPSLQGAADKVTVNTVGLVLLGLAGLALAL